MNTLSSKQIASAQTMIDGTPAGEYELKQIYGTSWNSIVSPTKFGRMFKVAVKAGKLRNIRLHTLKTNNHRIYVLGKSV
jgi:Domain of unknown function (DUF1413)